MLFRRTALTGELPHPASSGDLDRLWKLINVRAPDRPVALAWMVAAIISPAVAHAILALFGEQGTGKSSASRILVDLIDPSPVPLRKAPKDPDQWVTAAAGSWLVGLDNLSTVPDWLSDSLCRAATGDGDVRRQLYTDGQLAVFAFRRVVLLNGIDLGALRGDLAERVITIDLDLISEEDRRGEEALTAEWQAMRPAVFTGLLDLCADVQAVIHSVELDRTPRMADFARVLAAVDRVLGTTGLDHYTASARTMAADTLTADPFLAAMMKSITEFTGTSAELIAKVPTEVDHTGRPVKGWPSNARTITTLLKRNAPALRKAGWTVGDLSPVAGVKRWHLRCPTDESLGEGGESIPSIPESPQNTGEDGKDGMPSPPSLNGVRGTAQ